MPRLRRELFCGQHILGREWVVPSGTDLSQMRFATASRAALCNPLIRTKAGLNRYDIITHARNYLIKVWRKRMEVLHLHKWVTTPVVLTLPAFGVIAVGAAVWIVVKVSR